MDRLAPALMIGAIAAAALLGACQPAPAPQASASPSATAAAPAPAQAASGCAAHASRTWDAYTVEADTLGPDCAHAVAVMVIRKADGDPVFQWTLATQYIIGLSEAKDAAAMTTGIRDFVNDAETGTTATLPEWKTGADTPMRGEFAFMPAEGIDRAAYAGLRKQALPMFCFAQGLESMNCLALRDGMFESVGLQLLPG